MAGQLQEVAQRERRRRHPLPFETRCALLRANGWRADSSESARASGHQARYPPPMIRHFTVTAFVSWGGHTLLHWHEKNGMWLPPGGHVEPNEDPEQAVHREVLEETGLRVRLLPTTPPLPFDSPRQLVAPVTLLVEAIAAHPVDGPHQHLDLIYFTAPIWEGEPASPSRRAARSSGRTDGGLRVSGPRDLPTPPVDGWTWASRADLETDRPLVPPGAVEAVPVVEDVRVLGIAAIERAAAEER